MTGVGLYHDVVDVRRQAHVRTGEVVTPPCVVPIRTYPVSVDDGTVYIQPSES